MRRTDHIGRRDASLVVDLAEPPSHAGPTAQVAALGELLRLARRYEAVLMRARGEEGAPDQFWVWDQGMLFHCVAADHSITRDQVDDLDGPRGSSLRTWWEQRPPG